ncbi:hypothetical protein Ahy_B05g077720 [Arachis hypogaea]|uniref:TCP domain-containing protein n=1 Tax=Arachis hypogaea TaxID=3818 RepID=A0A444Z5C5_ARAHY|nr:hypothetical protein Ahy_B05g077720 [Arachis hypogaea]
MELEADHNHHHHDHQNGIRTRPNFPLQLLEKTKDVEDSVAEQPCSTAAEQPGSYFNPSTFSSAAVAAAVGGGRIRGGAGDNWERSMGMNMNMNMNMNIATMEDSRRLLFPGSSENCSNSMGLNFNPSTVNAVLQAKQELREDGAAAAGGGGNLDLDGGDCDGNMARKRRMEQEVSVSHQIAGNYLLQSSTAGSVPASHASNPATFWMVTGHQGMNGGGGGGGSNNDQIWAIPSLGSGGGVYRGGMPGGVGGIHFMNFGSPMSLMPGGQLGSAMVGGGSGGGGAMLSESNNLGMLAALNAYRQIPANGSGVSESPASTGNHQHHGGDDGHETTSQQQHS